MHLFKTRGGPVVADTGQLYEVDANWDELIARDDLPAWIRGHVADSEGKPGELDSGAALAPIGSQEVWAAGVTYYRSRDARIEESKDAGGGTFYDKVYDAERPELFLKATPHRVVGHGEPVRIRADATWNVPEPELTLVVSAGGTITGFTVGNDMSSRDIEGQNPLYLPQAKVYSQSCALGPGILLSDSGPASDWGIAIGIERGNKTVFEGSTTLAELKRRPEELVEFLYRDNEFPAGCFLMTGTGVVPPSTFTLAPGDIVTITIDSVGTLRNSVVQRA